MDGSSRGRGVRWLAAAAATWALLVALAGQPALAQVYPVPKLEDMAHWHQLGANDLQDAMFAATMHDWSIAKNVVIFVGDGMGITPSVAGRIYKGQRRDGTAGEEGYLAWERFPNMGLMKTYVLETSRCPTARPTATAYADGGAKANMYTLAWTTPSRRQYRTIREIPYKYRKKEERTTGGEDQPQLEEIRGIKIESSGEADRPRAYEIYENAKEFD
nr:alkaline phosphatase, tissue-nonspecific isozyme-like [Penaeus vannamei]